MILRNVLNQLNDDMDKDELSDILKYLFRQGRNEGTNDLKKCLDYLNQLNDDMDKDELSNILKYLHYKCD